MNVYFLKVRFSYYKLTNNCINKNHTFPLLPTLFLVNFEKNKNQVKIIRIASVFVNCLYNQPPSFNVLRTRYLVQFCRRNYARGWYSPKKVEAAPSEELAKLLFCHQLEFIYFFQNVRHILLKFLNSEIVLKERLVYVLSFSSRIDNRNLLTKEDGSLFQVFFLNRVDL